MRSYKQWLRDMVMDSVGSEEAELLSSAIMEKLERNTVPAPKRDTKRPWRTVNEGDGYNWRGWNE